MRGPFERFLLHRFEKIIFHAIAERGPRIFKITVSAQDDDVQVREILFGSADQFQAAHSGHLDIRDQDIKVGGVEKIQRFLPGVRFPADSDPRSGFFYGKAGQWGGTCRKRCV